MQAIQHILSRTPTFVWIILGVLVWRGIAASRDRIVPVRQLFILPLALLALSVSDLSSRFGLHGLPPVAWLAGAAATALLAANVPSTLRIERATGLAFVPGSWLPLALMMTIFATKYALAILSATHPELLARTGFAIAACTLSGALSGILPGRMLHAMRALRQPALA
ncbi:hypothetical protein IP91_01318 [Pseudoduganella lurida]|uniref:Transmembrane protein n=1 Tax=Pseudoduganella lurida TaxID=1036180 RepID=A0A562RNX0_9BURK|nr:DUF6622 family protein [Pseudoduganella lurida]TWI70234.1 hypothetical protein IP91_01318 [Pseudoduganella lurida]